MHVNISIATKPQATRYDAENTPYLIGTSENFKLGLGFAFAHFGYFERSGVNVCIWICALKTIYYKLANAVIDKDCS